jgi:DNA replication protein DnaC
VAAYNAAVDPEDGTGVDCPTCHNKGLVAFVHPESENFTIRPCKCYRVRQTVKRLQRCGVWKQAQRYQLKSFRTNTPSQKAMKSITEDFIADPKGHWLLLCGQSGAGKTHLCTAAFVSLTYQLGLSGEYFLWNRDGRRLKASVMEDPEHLWDRYRKAELLYIDDLFQGARSEADRRMAFELLDYRYNNDLITILSSELTFEGLLALDEAIAGRIREKCGPYLVNIDPGKQKNYRFHSQASETA